MPELRYQVFHEYQGRLQKRIHLFLLFPVPVFVFLMIRLDNGRIRPWITGEDFTFYLRNTLTIVSLLIIILSVLAFGVFARNLARNDSLRSKLLGYYNASLIREIFLGVIFIANLSGLALTGEKYYAGLSGIILVVFLLGYPSAQRIIYALKLDQKDSEIIYSNGKIE